MNHETQSVWQNNDFCLSLACHLLGSRTVHSQLTTRAATTTSTSLYWRTPFLCDPHITTTNQKLWVDLTWTFESDRRDIALHMGVLILCQSSSTRTARYVAKQPLALEQLQRHFGTLSIDLHATPPAVLAETMARAWKRLTTSDCGEPAVELYYEDLEASAPLPASGHESILDATILDLMLQNIPATQQQKQESGKESTSATATTTAAATAETHAAATAEPTVSFQDVLSLFQQWQQMQRKDKSNNNEKTLSAESQPAGINGAPPAATTVQSSDTSPGNENKTAAKRKEPSSSVPVKKKVIVQRGHSRMGVRKKPTKLKFATK